MNESPWLAQQFEERRTHLSGVAYRMLGSRTEAEDALQEAWLRASRAGTDGVDNLGGWLTTVVARVCLDTLRSRKSRREDSLDDSGKRSEEPIDPIDPEEEAILADSIGTGLMIVLNTLGPGERVAFVLHDLFEMPFDQIAKIVGRSPAATRQLASRARRRVRGGRFESADVVAQRDIVRAFRAASREGNFEALLALLDPSVVLRSDATVLAYGGDAEVRGPEDVANTFAGRAQAALPALLAGTPGLVWMMKGVPQVAFSFSFEAGRISAIDLIGEPAHLSRLEIELDD